MKITDNPKYKLAVLILSQKGEFTIDDIIAGLEEKGIVWDRERLKKQLDKMRDNRIIVERDGKYEVDLRDFE
jgi:hypothetical protein